MPLTSPYTGSQFATNQTVELATCRLESIFEFLDFVQLPDNNDIRYSKIQPFHIIYLLKRTPGDRVIPIRTREVHTQ